MLNSYFAKTLPTHAKRVLLSIVALLFITFNMTDALGQTGRANITGTVTDSQGAVVAGATVTATNNSTGVATPATTNGAGVYNIIQITPGVYTVKVEKEGFGAQVQENYTLVAEQNAGISFTLQPGKVSEKVTVQAGAELVHTETAELGQTINEEEINELPLNGRNPASLVLLTPGAMDVLTTGVAFAQSSPRFQPRRALRQWRPPGQHLLSVGRRLQHGQLRSTASPFPNPDAVQEFSVIGNNFDPRYGFATGGVVSIVTKSGTNNWHGDVFEYFRNGALNSKDYFTRPHQSNPPNQFGGSLGGPIIKDKLFVFGNYQGTRISFFNSSSSVYVPSHAMQAGDFSAVCSGFTNGICNDRNHNPAKCK